VPDDGATSQDDAGDEPGQLPTPSEATADHQVSADNEGSPSSSQPSQTSGPEELQEGEPAGQPDVSEESPASIPGERGLPDMSPEAVAEQMLALERSRDAQRNTETRPPDSETVTFRSVTVAEVYVGREADNLTAALGAIEWINFDEPIAEKIAEARKDGEYYRAQFVFISDPSRGLRLRGYGKVSLPEGIERIYGQSYVLGPSLVAVALTFVLTDAEAGRLDTALRDEAQSRVERTGSTQYTPKTVYHVKSERAHGIQDELSKRCLAWLKKKFPGTLVAGDGLRVPVCSLLSLAEGKPFHTQAEYMRLLNLTNGFFAYKFARPDFLFLTPRIGRTRERELIAAFSEADALSPGSYPDLSAMSEIFHEAFSPFMIIEAVQGVLRSFKSRMRDIRSDLEKLDFDHATELQVLGLRNQLLGMSRDIAIVSGDAAIVVDDAVMIWADYPLLVPVDPSQSLPPTAESTADATRSNLRSLMANLQAQETGLRELVLITSQAINDAQNMQLQKKVLTLTGRLSWLTIVLVILTLALVFIGVVQLVDPPSTGTSSPGVAPHTSTPAARASTAGPKTPNRT
jgi:hypothetical protein